MLTALVADIEAEQSNSDRSKIERPGVSAEHGGLRVLHADARILHGFSPAALIAEFRALRASALRLYDAAQEAPDLVGIRASTAIDEALTESMMRFGIMTDIYRDQFIGVLRHDLHIRSTPFLGGCTADDSADADQRPPGSAPSSFAVPSGWNASFATCWTYARSPWRCSTAGARTD